MSPQTADSPLASEAKLAAIEQWTADPCGLAEGEPGSATYFKSLLEAKEEYSPWLSEVLEYSSTDGLRVLDVGCGQGVDLTEYARHGADAFGVDLTPRHVELARLHLRTLGLDGTVLEADAESLPFDNANFDRVSSNGVLHHTPDMLAALREIRRVLRPGGEARIIVYNKASLHYWVNQILLQGLINGGLRKEGSMRGVLSHGVEYSRIGARPLVRVYRPVRLRKMMQEAGFSGVATQIRHYSPGDAFLHARLAPRLKLTTKPALLEWLGRRFGWYVIGYGTRSR